MSLAASLCPPRVAGPQDQPRRRARRPRLPGRRDRRAARRRGRALRRQRRDGRRGAARSRLWERATELGLSRVALREHARPRARRLLPRRSSALQDAALRELRRRAPADRHRARADRHRRPPAHVRVHEPRRREGGRARARSPPRWRTQVAEYREKLLDAVVETDEALMERYLEGEELGAEEVAQRAQGRGHARRALPGRVRRRDEEPRHDARCSTCSSRASRRRRRRARRSSVDGASTAAFVFKTIADPFAGRINVFRVLEGHASTATRRS